MTVYRHGFMHIQYHTSTNLYYCAYELPFDFNLIGVIYEKYVYKIVIEKEKRGRESVCLCVYPKDLSTG